MDDALVPTVPGFWKRLAETRDAALAAKPVEEVPVGPTGRPLKYRCEECGRLLRGLETCPAHVATYRLQWTRKLVVAYHLVCLWGDQGKDLDRWVEQCPESDVTGTTRGDLALALACARSWKQPEFTERELPRVVSPKGLYG